MNICDLPRILWETGWSSPYAVRNAVQFTSKYCTFHFRGTGNLRDVAIIYRKKKNLDFFQFWLQANFSPPPPDYSLHFLYWIPPTSSSAGSSVTTLNSGWLFWLSAPLFGIYSAFIVMFFAVKKFFFF